MQGFRPRTSGRGTDGARVGSVSTAPIIAPGTKAPNLREGDHASQPARNERSKDASGPIRFITRKWPPAIGGMETYALKLSAALRHHAPVQVTALPGRSDGGPPRPAALIGFGLRAAARLLATRAPRGIVHVGDMALWPLALVARLRSRRWRLALSAHGTDVSYSLRGGVRGRLYGAYLRLGARCLRPAMVIANSTATADCARQHGFCRISIVPLATDMRATRPGRSAGALPPVCRAAHRAKGLRLVYPQRAARPAGGHHAEGRRHGLVGGGGRGAARPAGRADRPAATGGAVRALCPSALRGHAQPHSAEW